MIYFNLLFFKLLSFGLFFSTVSQNSNVKFLGCFLEDNLLYPGEESSVLNRTSPYSCSEFCSSKQYRFFLLKHDTYYCNKNNISRLIKQLDYECSTKCIGDESTSCGGTPNLVSSYLTNSSRKCPPMTTDSLDMQCIYNGDYADCSNPSIPGTKLTPKCKVTYKMDNPSGYTPTVLRCLDNGTWNDRINLRCVPECGQLFAPNNSLVVDHHSTPWNVVIYRKRDKIQTYEYLCVGTIISPNLVISAAHCFSEVELVHKVLMSNGMYKIGVGKYTRDISIMDNQHTKIIDVNSVYLHDEYSGADGFYKNDIAVIVLSDKVVYSTMVAPVCMDWTEQYTALNGSIGKVAGWGKTEKLESSAVLLEANLPYINRKTCLKLFSKEFKNYVTLDKYCAGFIESSGQAVHEGDSGAGFTLEHNDVHYLTGIVSLNDPTASHLTAFFTEVRYHIKWIHKILTDMKSEK